MNLIDTDALVSTLRRSTKANQEGTEADVFRQWIMEMVIPSLKSPEQHRRMTPEEMERAVIILEKRLLELEQMMQKRSVKEEEK